METVIVCTNPTELKGLHLNAPVISQETYLTHQKYQQKASLHVINLSENYAYQSTGYYISLLSEAREHNVIPTIEGIQDIRHESLLKWTSQKIEEDMEHELQHIKHDIFDLYIFFGVPHAKCYEPLARTVFAHLKLPLIKMQFVKKRRWSIEAILPVTVAEISPKYYPILEKSLSDWVTRQKRINTAKKSKKHDIGILIDDTEMNPPSNPKALERFVTVAKDMGISADIIQKKDMHSLSLFDALFIRATTSVNHYTYQYAREASEEHKVVIDDPHSILTCTNKVFLAELLNHHRIHTPRTQFIHKNGKKLPHITFPCILKRPDSAFSLGVVKVDSQEEYQNALTELFQYSDMVIAQEFIPTPFDWRIGILNHQPIFACRYYMAPNHWQIYHWDEMKKEEGATEAVPLSDVPDDILKTALTCSRLIGDGLYGVDLKATENAHYVIEINDNPNIDAGIEDAVLGDKLYEIIMEVFLSRIRKNHHV